MRKKFHSNFFQKNSFSRKQIFSPLTCIFTEDIKKISMNLFLIIFSVFLPYALLKLVNIPFHLVWKVGLYTYCLSSRAYCLNTFFSLLHNVQFLQSSYAQIYSQMPVKWISIFSAFSWIYVFNVANILAYFLKMYKYFL